MWSWIPIELFLSLNCEPEHSFVMVPLTLLIWGFELRWLWSDESESEVAQDEVWARRGRLLLFLYVGLCKDSAIRTAAHISEETSTILLIQFSTLAQIVPVPTQLGPTYFMESIVWGVMIMLVGNFWRNINHTVPLILQLWATGFLIPTMFIHSRKMNQVLSNTTEALRTSKNEEILQEQMKEPTRKTEEEGKLLIQAMAPEIVLNMLSESDVFVSALCERNGTFRWVSNSVERLYGYTQNELIGTNGWSTVHPDDIKYLMTLNRDSSNRVRMHFRRRRKDGSYASVESFGLYSEGFIFFQEYEKKPENMYPTRSPDEFDPSLSSVSALASHHFAKPRVLSAAELEALSLLHMDAIQPIQGLTSCDLRDCINATVKHAVDVRDRARSNNRKKFRAVLDSLLTDESNQTLVMTNPDRLSYSLTSIIDVLLELPSNQELIFEVRSIRNNADEIEFKFSAREFPQNDLRFECAKSFAFHAHRGTMQFSSLVDLSVFTLVLNFSANNTQGTSATCLIVDDDDTILTIMKKRLVPIWRQLHGTELSVITSKTGQEALTLARQFLPQRFVFASVDLNLSDSSRLTGEETVQQLKIMQCADRVVVLTSTSRPNLEATETVYLKGAPDLYTELCRKS